MILEKERQARLRLGISPSEDTKVYLASLRLARALWPLILLVIACSTGGWAANRYVSNVEEKVIQECDKRYVSKEYLEQRLVSIEKSMAGVASRVEVMCALLRKQADSNGTKKNAISS